MTNNTMSKSPKASVKVEKVEPKMYFPAAIKAVIDGKKITRRAWPDKEAVAIVNNYLCITNKEGSHQLILSVGDLEAEDWVVV